MSFDEALITEVLPWSSLSIIPRHLYHPDEVRDVFIRLGARPIGNSRTCFKIKSPRSFIAAMLDLEETEPDAYGIFSRYNLRYDVFEDNIVVIRMPASRFYSLVVSGFTLAIREAIDKLCASDDRDSDTLKALDSITGVRDVYFVNDRGLTCPDLQFGTDIGSHVIIDFVYTKSFEGMGGLARKLYSHVTSSGNEVNKAVGLEWYGGQTRLSVWAPKTKLETHGEHNIILNRQLITNESQGKLEMLVKDFISNRVQAEEFPALDPTAKISIRYADIAEFVDKARISQNKYLSWAENEVKLRYDNPTTAGVRIPSVTVVTINREVNESCKAVFYSSTEVVAKLVGGLRLHVLPQALNP